MPNPDVERVTVPVNGSPGLAELVDWSAMRIERENREHVGSVWAVFTAEELRQLLDHLIYYFEDDETSAEWHAHIGEGPDNELTITVEDPIPTLMLDVPIGRVGRVINGPNAGLYIEVDDDTERTGGFYVLLWTSPSATTSGTKQPTECERR